MDPVLKSYLYNQWLADQRDDGELARNHALLLGSFWNPEAVDKMLNADVISSTDDDFDESSRWVREANLKALQQNQDGKKRKKKRANLVKD